MYWYVTCACVVLIIANITLSIRMQILMSVQLVPVAVMSMLTALTLLVGIPVLAILPLLELGEYVLQVGAFKVCSEFLFKLSFEQNSI